MIYLDHNATTHMLPEVIDACVEALRGLPGNPSSVHRPGQAARHAVERARSQLGALINAAPRALIFTSGATEANQMALRGALDPTRSPALLTSAAEHPSVVGAAAAAVETGVEWQVLPIDDRARLDLEALARALREREGRDVLVSVMLAQNELGNRYPIAEVVALARRYGARVHCDATQAVGRVPVDVEALGVDLLSLSGHKFGGPKGVGALYARRGVELTPLLRGGHQERGRRAGTENLTGIIGLGVAAEAATRDAFAGWSRARQLAQRLGERLTAELEATHWLGDREANIGTTCCLAFDDAPADEVLMALDLEGIAVSAGSACASGSLEPSPVLLAANVPGGRARCAVRFSTGPTNTDAEIDRVVAVLLEQIPHIRATHRRH